MAFMCPRYGVPKDKPSSIARIIQGTFFKGKEHLEEWLLSEEWDNCWCDIGGIYLEDEGDYMSHIAVALSNAIDRECDKWGVD